GAAGAVSRARCRRGPSSARRPACASAPRSRARSTPPLYRWPSPSDGPLDHRVDLRLRHRPDDLIGDLPVLEQEQGRDAHYPILLGNVLVRVDVQLADLELALVLRRELIDERRNRPA